MAVVSLGVKGFEELDRKLRRVVEKTQKKIVNNALRKESRKAKKRVTDNIKRMDLIDSGMMLAAFEGAALRSANKKSIIIQGVAIPTREQLGIDPDDKYFYPYAVEYGHVGAPAKPFIRPAIDNHREESIRAIGEDIGKGIEREALK